MILAVDVGNTHTVAGLYDTQDLAYHWRFVTEAERTADEYGVLLQSLFTARGLSLSCVAGIIASSVVPAMVQTLEDLAQTYFQLTPLIVGPGIKTGMPILYDNPREVGADRIVNAVAAYERYRTATIIVDFGTATTFDYVTQAGEYLGGAIVPWRWDFPGCALSQNGKTLPGRIGQAAQDRWPAIRSTPYNLVSIMATQRWLTGWWSVFRMKMAREPA